MKPTDWAEKPVEFAAIVMDNVKAFYEVDYANFCDDARGFETDVVRCVTTEDGALDEAKLSEFVKVIEAWVGYEKRTDLLGYCRALMSASYGTSLRAQEMIKKSSPVYLQALMDGAYWWGLLEQGSWEEKLELARDTVSIAASNFNDVESFFYAWCREQGREGNFELEIVEPISDSADKYGRNESEWQKVCALIDDLEESEQPTLEGSFQLAKARMMKAVGCSLVTTGALREGFVEHAYMWAQEGRTTCGILAGRAWGAFHASMQGVGLKQHLRKANDASTARYRAQRDDIYAWCSMHLESFRRQHAHRAVKEAAKAILEQRVAALELEVVCRHIRAFQGKQIELRQL